MGCLKNRIYNQVDQNQKRTGRLQQGFLTIDNIFTISQIIEK